jgi:hypothetical protein|tara:strand:+ start:3573 stop:3773 length:201 start_codon:yes stop_codon:yes gene_type:complete
MSKKKDDSMDYLESSLDMDERYSQASIFLSSLIINTQQEGSTEYEDAIRNTVLAMTLIPPAFYAKC